MSRDREDLFAFRTPSFRNVTLTGPWGHSGVFNDLESMMRHHLNPLESLESYDVSDAILSPLEQVQILAGRGSDFGFKPLDDGNRVAFGLRDSWVMRTPSLRARLASENELVPIDLTEAEILQLLAFLSTLTDPTAVDRSHLIPERLPSGLAPQPERPKNANF